ncbi:MAG: rhodanese-like domain-containing protein [Candidatus Malihini olakiniferum]
MQEIMSFLSRHPIMSISWIALSVAVIVMIVENKLSKVKEIACDEAIQLINKEEAVVVDLRNRDDFRHGHIANAINLLSNDIKNGSLGELKQYKTRPVIVICVNGMSSRESAGHLLKVGFGRVFVLKDGLSGWSGNNLPLVQGKK